jgi:hypothetical protein
MAVENRKSNIVGGLDASPATRENSDVFEGRIQQQAQFIESEAADDDGSIYRLFRVPSNARLSSLKQTNDVIANGTDYDWGVYQTLKNGGAVLAGGVALLAAAVDNSSARLQPAELLTIDPADAEKPLWALLGLSADPSIEYDICATGNTVGDGGTIAAELQYSI